MNNPNPFVPKGSLLEQQSQRRSRLKLAVFCVVAVCVTGLIAMLIQGCKREQPATEGGLPPLDTTNPIAMDYTNPPIETNPPPPIPAINTKSGTRDVLQPRFSARCSMGNGVKASICR